MPEEFYKDFPEFTNLKPRVQGVENVRRIVKALVAHKVDFIKILATERAGTPDTDPRKRTFTDEEIVAIVDEANKAGIPVAAHAHGDEGAYAAVRAGVRSIEHGSYLSDKTLALMKSRRTYLVPTFSFWEQTAATLQNKDNPVLAERIKTFVQLVHGVTSRAYKMGVSVVAGTDTRYVVSGLTMESEAAQLQKAGMSAMDIIKAMTHRSAQCLRIDARTGTVKKGMEADLVVLEQNPLSDITALKKIVMVVNDGKVVINRLQ
jgi:imidazolonepropionase-like amidohydrolase